MTAPATWSIKTFLQRLEAKHGPTQRAMAEPITRSLDDNLYFQRYHYGEARRLMAAHVAPSASDLDVVLTMLSPSHETEPAFHASRRQAAAHVLALVRCMHGDEDLLAQLVYVGTAMNLTAPLKPAAIALRQVATYAPAGALRDALEEVQGVGDAPYLADLCNHGKHRSHVPVPYSVDLTEAPAPHGLRFVAFEKDGRVYPARWVEAVLPGEYARRNDLIRRIGTLLDDQLQ